MKSKLENLDFLKPPEEIVEPAYTWEELAAEDPLLRDKHVWRNIDYGVESSDDEALSQSSVGDLDVTETTTLSSVNDEDFRRVGDFVVPIDPRVLSDIQKDQFWRAGEEVRTTPMGGSWMDPKIQEITDLQTIRETLFMLSGLPTAIFVETANGIVFKETFGLKHASNNVFHGFLDEFCTYGTDILSLRKWSKSKQQIPLLQNLQDGTAIRLRHFDHIISKMHDTLVAPNRDTIVSIVKIRQELQSSVQPVLKLSRIVSKLVAEPYAHAFRCLELLYNETCTLHMAGDYQSYQFMGELFFDCFRVYLRPIRTWMEAGELAKDDRIFFVSESEGDIALAYLWQDRFRLRKTPDGILHAPSFLQSLAARRIFTTGKSVVILRKLGRYDLLKSSRTNLEPDLRFQSVCDPSALSLIPFPELFDIAFEEWIQSKHHTASSILRECLFGDCGLRTSLEALENIYFMQDGATTGVLANAIFDKLSNGNSRWNDRFTVTELAHSTMGTLKGVTADRLRVSFANRKYDDVQRARKTVKSLADFVFTYNLPWPVQIVITKETMLSYQKIFSFLLQIRRSTYMLERTCLLRDSENDNSGADERALFYGVRSRLLWFTSTLYNHLTDLVIATNTLRMHQVLTSAEDVDQMIQVHASYVKNLTDQALLGPKLGPIHQAIVSILDLSIKLSDARAAHASTQGAYRSSMSTGQEKTPPRRKSIKGEESVSSDEEGDNSEADISTLSASTMNLPYIDQLRATKAKFDRLHKFVSTGLRAVARAGDQGTWDMLAEKLEGGTCHS